MHLTRDQIKVWFVRLFFTGGTQAVIQAAGLVAGVLIIRTLPPQDYAYYTIAYAVLGTLGVLCDGGISTGVTALGAKVWQDPDQLGRIYQEGMRLRRRFSVAGLMVALPILGILLHRQGASTGQGLTIALSLIPTFFSNLTGQLREISLRLHQRLRELQVTQLTAAGVRLALLCASLPLWPTAAVAILASGLPQVWANRRLQKKAAPLLILKQQQDLVIRRELWRYVGKILPGAVYYALSGQITIWLISVFGNSQAVAEVGAAGRLAMIMSVIGTVFGLVIAPRFARLPDNHPYLLGYYYGTMAAVALSSAFLITPFVVAPRLIDLALGVHYVNQHTLVYLSFISSCLGLVTGAGYILTSGRGHVVSPWVTSGLYLFFQIVLISMWDLTTAQSVLTLGCALNAIPLIVYLIYGGLKFRPVINGLVV